MVEALGRGIVADPALRVRAGEIFTVTVPAAPPALPRPQAMPLAIVYEDEHLIVIDKPAGLVVHAGAGNPDGTLSTRWSRTARSDCRASALSGRVLSTASTKTPAVCSWSPRPTPRTWHSRVSSPSTRSSARIRRWYGEIRSHRWDALSVRSGEVAIIAPGWRW